MWDALGPFPRSVWIHPHAPEDDLDRVCFQIWKRSELAKKGIWPHSPVSSVFTGEPPADDVYGEDDSPAEDVYDEYNVTPPEAWTFPPRRSEEQDRGLSGQSHAVEQSEQNKAAVLVQREYQDLKPPTVAAPHLSVHNDSCSHGDDPDDPDEDGISSEEKHRRCIQKFLKGVLITGQETKKTSKLPSEEDFPPLPSAASPWGDRPAQRPHARGKAGTSGSWPTSSSASTWGTGGEVPQQHAGPAGTKTQRTQSRWKKRHSFKPLAFTKTALIHNIRPSQGSLPQGGTQAPGHRQPPGLPHTGGAVEGAEVAAKEASEKDQREPFAANMFGSLLNLNAPKTNKEDQKPPKLSVFAPFRQGGEVMIIEDQACTGGDVDQGTGADGAHVAQDTAGTARESVSRAAGPHDQAKRPPCQKGATQPESEVAGSANGKDVPLQREAEAVPIPAAQPGPTEQQSTSRRRAPHKPLLPRPQRGPAAGTPSRPRCPACLPPIRLPPGFTYPQYEANVNRSKAAEAKRQTADTTGLQTTYKLNPQVASQLAALLFLYGLLPPARPGLPFLPPLSAIDPSCMSGDGPQWPFAQPCSDNVPDNGNPQRAGRECFMNTPSVPPGFTAADAASAFRHPV